LTNVSPACAQVWGYSADELIGKRYLTLVLPEDAEATVAYTTEAKTKPTTLPLENRIKRKNGEVAYMLWSIVWSEAEKTFFCVVHDTTERQEIERLKQEFVSMVSHELRSPLNSVLAFLNMLPEGVYGKLSEQGLKKAQVANRNIERLIKLINDLLDVEKLESGRLVLHFAPTEIARVIERATEAVRGLAEKEKITIEAADISVAIDADEER